MTSAFIQSATILIREGLEAMLVIAAWLFELFNNVVHNDILEGATIFVAAALMLYVSGWLLLRQDPRAWQGFLKTKAETALAKQTGAAVAGLALGAAVLVVLFMIINVVARRLPLRPVFLVTSGFLFLMAIKFIGEAIQE